jgi:hypothetical protein
MGVMQWVWVCCKCYRVQSALILQRDVTLVVGRKLVLQTAQVKRHASKHPADIVMYVECWNGSVPAWKASNFYKLASHMAIPAVPGTQLMQQRQQAGHIPAHCI